MLSSFDAHYAHQPAASDSSRLGFIRNTYLHLLLNVLVFGGLVFALLATPLASGFYQAVFSSRFGWLALLLGFGIGAGLLQSLAYNSSSKLVQYAVLFGFVALEAIIFVPVAVLGLTTGVLGVAFLATALLFGVLTVSVLVTKTNYNFLRGFLVAGSLAALGVVVLGIIFNLSLFGTIFTVAMILLMCGWILYDTSKIARSYPTDKYVAASIAIFADFVTLLWYVVRLLSGTRR